MLDAGAMTFWEEFDSTDEDRYAMYGRAFGKSLCHAWSAGPAALLPELVLGVRPLTDGWRRFEVIPELSELDWAGAAVPVPGGGMIVVTVDQAEVNVEVPDGLVLERPDAAPVVGPGKARWTVQTRVESGLSTVHSVPVDPPKRAQRLVDHVVKPASGRIPAYEGEAISNAANQ